MILGACNNPASEDAGKGAGDGDFDVAYGAYYADTSLTPGLPPDFEVIAPSDTIGYNVTGRLMRYPSGDSTVGTIGFVQVGIGTKVPASGTYDVYADSWGGGTQEGFANKARLYVWGIPGGMAWSDIDSSAGGKVKVVVTADSVQVLGKEIKLSNGKKLSFNLTAPKPAVFN
jgi:hypothetical protein